MKNTHHWKIKHLILGAILGAVAGAGTAYLLTRNFDENEPIKLNSSNGLKLGLATLEFVKKILNLGS